MIPFVGSALAKSDGIKKAALIIGGVTILGVGYFVISKRLKKQKVEQNYQAMEKQIGVNTPDGKAAGYATALFSAMDGWGTNEKIIWETLKKMKANGILFATVANAYRMLYNEDLLKRIQKELSAKEYVQFQEVI